MSPADVLLVVRVLLALVLYLFLGLIVVTQWRDLRAARWDREVTPRAHLLVLDAAAGGGFYPLAQSNEIGRAADNGVRLDDETVSAYHARLTHQGGQWWLEDLASRNGTAVNDLLLEEPIVVAYGDEIRCGRMRMRLESGVPSGDAQPPETSPS